MTMTRKTKLRELAFSTVIVRKNLSWDRATAEDADRLTRTSWLGWSVKLPDSHQTHHVKIVYDPDTDTWLGRCTCQHDAYQSDGEGKILPCAHLCSLRKLEAKGTQSVAYADPESHTCPTCGQTRDSEDGTPRTPDPPTTP